MSCHSPISVYIRSVGHSYLVPCGKCADCLNRKKQTWIHRIESEMRFGRFKNCYFVSLSYNEKYLPFVSYSNKIAGSPVNPISTGEPVLCPYDLRMFIKRFRLYSKSDCAYFAVGELGSEYNRPHFHVILFTDFNWQDCLKWVRVAWSRLVPESPSERKFRYALSRKLGKSIKRDAYNLQYRESFGRDQVRSVTFKRISYVAKYVNKIFGTSCIVPPFYRASHGLGSAFLQSLEARNIAAQNIHYSYLSSGFPVALHRFYSNRLYTSEQMNAFQLQMINQSSIPAEIVGNRELVKEWFDYYCVVEQARRRSQNLSFNHVRRI